MSLIEVALIFSMIMVGLIACVLIIPPEALIFLAGAVGAALVGGFGYFLLSAVRKMRENRLQIEMKERKSLARQIVKARDTEVNEIFRIARMIDLPDVSPAAETFVERHLAFIGAIEHLPASRVSQVDHVRRTLLDILQATHEAPGGISSQTSRELCSSLESGALLIDSAMARLNDDINGNVASSAHALSSQLRRMVRKATA